MVFSRNAGKGDSDSDGPGKGGGPMWVTYVKHDGQNGMLTEDELRAANQALVPQESDPPPWSEAESEMLMWLGGLIY